MKFKNLFGKMVAITVAATLLVGCLPTSALAQTAYTRGTFTYGAAENSGNLPDTFAYTDDYFAESADNSNLHLAIMSLQMAAASMSSNEAGYEDKSECIVDLMQKVGFADIEVNDDYKQKMTTESLGVAVGYKQLSDGSVLLAIVPRSAGYEQEWANNLVLGESGIHAGFKHSREIAYAFAKQYVADHASVFDGQNVKVWTMGYSRGAAVANVIAAGIVDDSQSAIGLDVARENIFDYNFGCANTTSTELAAAGNYDNIHNYLSDGDVIGMIPPAQWGLARYGTTTTISSTDAAVKAKMLSLLENLNTNVYNEYIDDGDPDSFKAKKVSFDGGGFSIVDDDSKQITQKEFLEDRFRQLVDKAIPDRATYASTYEKPLSEMIMLVKTNSRFTSGFMNSDSRNSLLLTMFFYDLVDQIADTYTADEDVASAIQNILALKPGTQTGDSNVDAILASDEWKQIYEQAEQILDADKGARQMLSEFQDLLASYMTAVLKDSLTACGYTGDDLENSVLLEEGAPLSLGIVLSQVLFGTDDPLPTSLDEAVAVLSNKAGVAASLYGNGNRFSRVHDNDVMISWLRAEDPDPIPATDPEPEEQPASTEVDASRMPATGDSASAVPVVAIAVAGAALAGIGLASRKRCER